MARSFMHSNKHINPFLDSNFTTLFNELYPPLCRYAISLVEEREIAEDIVQDQFVYLWENKDKLSEVRSIKSYLFTAVKNQSINYLQRNKQRFNNSLILDDISSEKLVFSLDPSVITEGIELEELIKRGINSLPQNCRTIFCLKRFGDLSNKEIAKELSISIKTVEAQITIAIKKLSAFISSHWTSIVLFISTMTLFQN